MNQHISGQGHAVAGRDLLLIQFFPGALNPDEAALIAAYRSANSAGKKALLAVAAALEAMENGLTKTECIE